MKFELADIKKLVTRALREEPTGDVWLDNRYNEQRATINHTNPYYRLFYLIAQQLKPNVVVELGGWQGTAAAHFAAGHPEAMVITIDHHSDPGDDLNRAKMLGVVDRYPNVNYVQGWTSPGFVEEYHKGQEGWPDVKKLLGRKKIDILFIDSWHEGRYFKRDYDQYSPLLANPALVICDDILDTPLFLDMVAFWDSLPGEKFLNDEVHPGIPMGFIKNEVKRPAKARKPRQKRTTTKKAT